MATLQKGFVHTVFFWLKDKGNDNHRQGLHEGLLKLAENDLMVSSYIGIPADTDREVIDASYDFSLTFIFKNKADQDTYQTHPQHLAFIDNCAQYWERVQVYDATS